MIDIVAIKARFDTLAPYLDEAFVRRNRGSFGGPGRFPRRRVSLAAL
jgi:hypothetical protein